MALPMISVTCTVVARFREDRQTSLIHISGLPSPTANARSSCFHQDKPNGSYKLDSNIGGRTGKPGAVAIPVFPGQTPFHQQPSKLNQFD